MLQEAGPGSWVQFDVARLGKLAAEALELKLSESPDPFFGWRKAASRTPKAVMQASLMAQGIETIRIRQRVAMRYGANDGLLVVYVQPATAAFKAGLLPGDVIEAIDGQKLFLRFPQHDISEQARNSVFISNRSQQTKNDADSRVKIVEPQVGSSSFRGIWCNFVDRSLTRSGRYDPRNRAKISRKTQDNSLLVRHS